MHSKLEIVLRVSGLIIALGLIGTGFVFMLKKSEEPSKILFKTLFTIPFAILCIWVGGAAGLGGPFFIVFMAVVLSFMWTPWIAEWVSSPLTGMFDGGGEPIERKPLYSMAYA